MRTITLDKRINIGYSIDTAIVSIGVSAMKQKKHTKESLRRNRAEWIASGRKGLDKTLAAIDRIANRIGRQDNG